MKNWLKSFCIAFCAASAFTTPPAAQAQIGSGGLGALDPWGRGYLARDEQTLPNTLWRASRAEDLLPLMKQARTRNLTPAERSLLRRVVLSPGRSPSGDGAQSLLAERARLMFELGEAAAAADLMGRLEESPEGIIAEELAVDLEFALGRVATACEEVRDPENTGDFWLRMRAICFALEGNQAGADLAIELAQASDVRDEWLFAAITAAFNPDPDAPKPAAKFDTGYALTVSVLADLTVPVNSVGYSRPDLAAAMAKRSALPPELRVLAAGVASEAALVTPTEQLDAYSALLTQEDFRPNSPVEAALVSLAERGSSNSERARHIATALQASRGSSARFYAVARLLGPALKQIEHSEETDRYTTTFASALMATGDLETAETWILANIDADENGLNFEQLWIVGLNILMGVDPDGQYEGWAEALLETTDNDAKQAAAVRLFTLLAGRNITLPPEARAFLVEHGEGIGSDSTSRISAILAAAQADAAGEAILNLLKVTDGDPSKVGAKDLIIILQALDRLGLNDTSNELALEATGFWKTSLASE
ncbi:MAG: hypothetical protein AAFX02_03950 [Pseudomonadota bacterium]